MTHPYRCRMPQQDIQDPWFDDLAAARRWADENAVIGCIVENPQGETVYSPLRAGISDLLYHAKQFCDYARDKEFSYGDAPINPAINDDARLVSCDRLVGCCLYRWGWVDQPVRQGLRVACMRLADWCAEHGFTRVDRVEDLEPGDICFQRWDANHQPAHTYLYAGKGPEEGLHYRYDGGSVTRLRSTQPSCEPIHMFLFAYRPVAPADPVTPRFSFRYDGAAYTSDNMQPEATESGRIYTLPDGLQLECRIHRHPRQRLIRWQLIWHNPTDHASGQISHLLDCDVTLPLPQGDSAENAGLTLQMIPALPGPDDMGAARTVRLMAGESRHLSAASASCLEIRCGEDGWMVSAAAAHGQISRVEAAENGAQVHIGPENAGFRLAPGETLPSASITITGYLFSQAQGHNRWRACMKEIAAPIGQTAARAACPTLLQNQIQCAAAWHPGFAVDADSAPGDLYAWRSAYAPILTLRGQALHDVQDEAWQRSIREYQSIQDLLTQDFYPLLPASREDTGWSVSQFHDYEKNRGVILAFRRENSPFPTAHVLPRDLELYAHYEFVDADTGRRFLVNGMEASADGMDLTIPAPRQSILLTYRALLPGMPY